jgi:rubrerythrin
MRGVIRKRDVLAHPRVTIECFGWKVFFKALVAGRHRTFLSLIAEAGAIEERRLEAPEAVERAIGLELRAAILYDRLANKFIGRPEAARFFWRLAIEEREHADLLDLCRSAAALGTWDPQSSREFSLWTPRLEEKMDEAETIARGTSDLTDALRLVLEIESSEVNRLFRGIVEASRCAFVKHLRPFNEAVVEHIDGIRRDVAALEPDLEEDCRSLDAALPLPVTR